MTKTSAGEDLKKAITTHHLSTPVIRKEGTNMIYHPYEYQKYAIDFVVDHPAAALLLDMGLGKTSIALSAIEQLMYHRFEVSKVLVIAPLRVARNTWPEEFRKWDCFNGMTFSVAVGSVKERLAALRKEADVYIINRENIPWLIDSSGLPFDYDLVVVDELSSFKNHLSKRFLSLMKVRPMIRRIIGLTGTPTSNGLMDLFAEFKLLDLGKRLGWQIGQYRARYFMPDKTNGRVIYSYMPLPGAEEQIYKKISDITISMRAVDHLEMPKLIQATHKVYLEEHERDKYMEMKQNLALKLPGATITASNVTVLSGKLLQLANGAIYRTDGSLEEIHEKKLDALEDLIEAANGKPILVAYWYRHDLIRIKKRLDACGITCRKLDTDDDIREWNAGHLQVGLLHPLSASHGLNLQHGGNTLVWFGLNWSLELYQQTIGRLWRQGQQESTVVVQHIVTDGTIDERILKILKEKDQTQEALIEALKAEMNV